MGFSKAAQSYEMLIIGRLIIGFNCGTTAPFRTRTSQSLALVIARIAGLNTSLVPMYISEIAPLNLRGGLGTVNQLAVTVGILFSQILGIQEILGTEDGWPLLLGTVLECDNTTINNCVSARQCQRRFCLLCIQVWQYARPCCSSFSLPFVRNRLATCSSRQIAKKRPESVSVWHPLCH